MRISDWSSDVCSSDLDRKKNTVHGKLSDQVRVLRNCSIESDAEMAFEFISYARWVSIMLTSSSTTLTFEVSSAPCASVPRPFKPGVPVCGVPLADGKSTRLNSSH